MNVFGERLRELRMKKRLSQEALGAQMDVSQQVIQRWESGRNSPDIENVRRLASHFGVTADYLLGLVSVPNIYKHKIALPDGREGYLLDMVEDGVSAWDASGFVDFLRANPGVSPSDFPDEYKPLVQFVKAVLLESLRGDK